MMKWALLFKDSMSGTASPKRCCSHAALLTPSLTFSQILWICEKVTRRKLLGKQLAGANAFAASPDGCRHAVRISQGA